MSLYDITDASSQCDLHDCSFEDPHCHLYFTSSPPLMSTTDIPENQTIITLQPINQSNPITPGSSDCDIYSPPELSVVNSDSQSSQTLTPDQSSRLSYLPSPKTTSPGGDTDVPSPSFTTSRTVSGSHRHPDSPKPDLEEPVEDILQSTIYQEPSLLAGGPADILRTFTPTLQGTFSFANHPRRKSAPLSLTTNQEIGPSDITNLRETMRLWQLGSTNMAQRAGNDRTADWVGNQSTTPLHSMGVYFSRLSVPSPELSDSLTPKSTNHPPPDDRVTMPVTANEGIFEIGHQILPERINNSTAENMDPATGQAFDGDDFGTPRANDSSFMARDAIRFPNSTNTTMFDGTLKDHGEGRLDWPTYSIANELANQSSCNTPDAADENGDHSSRARYHRALQDIYLGQVENMLEDQYGVNRCQAETRRR